MTAMKLIRLILITAVLGLTEAYAADQPSIMRQTATRYEQAVSQVIADFVQHDRVPDSIVVLQLRTMENDMLGLAALSADLRAELPPLVVSQGLPLRDYRYVPGQLVVARLRAAGFDPLGDRLKGRTFVLATSIKR
jgi:hypothetical protein